MGLGGETTRGVGENGKEGIAGVIAWEGEERRVEWEVVEIVDVKLMVEVGRRSKQSTSNSTT